MPTKLTRAQLETLLGQVIIDNNTGAVDPADVRHVLLAHFTAALLEEDGVARLGVDGHVLPEQLPAVPTGNFIPTSEKGAVNGVGSLGATGHLLLGQLPPGLLDPVFPEFVPEDNTYLPGYGFRYTMPGEAGPSLFLVLRPQPNNFNPLPEAPPADPAAPLYFRLTQPPAAASAVVSNVMPAAWAAKTPGLLWQLPFVAAVCTVDEQGRRYVRPRQGNTVLYEPGAAGAISFVDVVGSIVVALQDFGWPANIIAQILNLSKDALIEMVQGIGNASYVLPAAWPALAGGQRLISAKRLVVDFIRATCGVFVPGAVVPFAAEYLGNFGDVVQNQPSAFAPGAPGEPAGAYYDRTHLTAALDALAELVVTDLAEGDTSPVTDFADRSYGVNRSEYMIAAAELMDRLSGNLN